MFADLEAMMAAASGARGGDDGKWLEAWARRCRAPQQVVVRGVPRHSRFAEVMVQADYRLKRLVDGTLTPQRSSLESLTDIVAGSLRDRIRATGGPVELRYAPVNRFWFRPGEMVYTVDAGIVELSRLRVVLATEAEYVTGGTLESGRRSGPAAQQFSDQVTARLPELAEEYPLFSALLSLFRHVALSRRMHRQGVETDMVAALLHDFPVTEVAVPDTLPGQPAVAEFEEGVGEATALRVRLPSCGGVSIAVDEDDIEVREAIGPRLRNLRRRLLASRPSASAVMW